MQAIARFASSDRGRMLDATSLRYGLDPAAGLPSVLAVNLRAALHVAAAGRDRAEADHQALPLDLRKAQDLEAWVATHGR